MCLFMCKRHLKHCYIKCVENKSRKKGNRKTHAKKHKHISRISFIRKEKYNHAPPTAATSSLGDPLASETVRTGHFWTKQIGIEEDFFLNIYLKSYGLLFL